MNANQFQRMLGFLERLKQARIHHEVASYREGALSVVVRGPGEYWEVDFLEDGTIDVERFISNGHIDDDSALEDLFAKFSDEEPVVSHDSTSR